MQFYYHFLKKYLKKKQEQTGKQYPIFLINSAINNFYTNNFLLHYGNAN